MSADKMREEFEAWFRAENESTLYCESQWRAWQASRAALVVELPKAPRAYPPNEASSDVDYWIDEAKWEMWADCKRAIEAAGVRVKP